MYSQFSRKLFFSIFNIAARTYSSRIVLISSRSVFRKNLITTDGSTLKVTTVKMSSGDVKKSITFEEVKTLKNNQTALLIDVREPHELTETGVLPGSVNIPLGIVETTLRDLPPEDFLGKYNREKPKLDTPLVFSCRSGRRSEQAQDIALNLGFKDVRNFSGGWLEWEEKNNQL